MSIDSIKKEFADLETQLQDPAVTSDPRKLTELTKKHAMLTKTVAIIAQKETLEAQIADTKTLIDDPELGAEAQTELVSLEAKLADASEQLTIALLPKDPHDTKDVVVEIRQAAGGDEAGLFAAELFRMYSKYAENNGWRTSIISASRTGIGGYKEIIFEIKGADVYKYMKYESGVHRVQRVPATEKAGRIHTSTVTVAVMPEAEDVDIQIRQEDLRIDVFRSSGPGGQSVNTTDSAVRITHIPTQLTVSMQDEKSQHKNKEKALKILRARLFALEEEKRQKEAAEQRLAQIGTGGRSEKIRTYNFPQDRVTDHRVGYTTSNIPAILDGNLNELTDALIKADQERLLKSQ